MKPFVELLRLRETYLRQHRAGNLPALEATWKSAFEDDDARGLPGVPAETASKLGAFGREWELALAAQALREDFALYELRISVLIRHAQEFQGALEGRLSDPAHFGAVLFAESAAPHALAGEAWKSNWFFVLRKGVIPRTLGISSLPGALLPFEIIPCSP